MKLSFEWLSDYISLPADLTPKQIEFLARSIVNRLEAHMSHGPQP